MISGVLLAAGRGARFGGDKLLASLADGRPMVLASLAALTAELEAVTVVVRPRQRQLIELLKEALGDASVGVTLYPCAAADQGMGHSIACGVQASRQAAERPACWPKWWKITGLGILASCSPSS